MDKQFLYCLDKTLTDKLKSEGFLLLNETIINNKPAWVFVIDNSKQLNFNKLDKNKVLLTNKLNF